MSGNGWLGLGRAGRLWEATMIRAPRALRVAWVKPPHALGRFGWVFDFGMSPDARESVCARVPECVRDKARSLCSLHHQPRPESNAQAQP